MKFFIAMFAVLIFVFLTGCSAHTGHLSYRKIQTRRADDYNISRTSKGVYVYKDNYSHNAVGFDPFYVPEHKNKNLDFGPGVVKFYAD